MYVGGSVALILVGAILRYAIPNAMPELGLDLPLIGLILLVIGVIGLAVSLLQTAMVSDNRGGSRGRSFGPRRRRA
jgi:hypothetical protein